VNKVKQKHVDGLCAQVEAIKVELTAFFAAAAPLRDKLEALKASIEAAKDEEEEALEKMSEGAKEGERGVAVSESIDEFELALEQLDATLDALNACADEELDLDECIARLSNTKGPQ